MSAETKHKDLPINLFAMFYIKLVEWDGVDVDDWVSNEHGNQVFTDGDPLKRQRIAIYSCINTIPSI